ncbi:metallophosphoesterase [Planomicrobium chinense]|uniref:metallophosphoesterase n=1 Tax=Planococcus chinensis TaxID=272917 RepID=UPI001CC4BFFE|nr:metallophosphoesterase [Planococcus chinensis]MBZ5202291.1 metallophosphoesterase [Planococcus chinensis]
MKWIMKSMLAALALLLFMFRNAFRQNLKSETVELPAAQPFKPFQLMFISDIHRRTLNGNLANNSVDMVIIGGDLAEKGVPLSRIEYNLKLLSGLGELYFIWGNHDRHVGEAELRQLFEKYKVTVLENEWVNLFGNPHLKLVGLDYFIYEKDAISKAFSGVRPEDTVLFASHTPSIFKYVRDHYSADFLLAGHTHGGQIRLGRFGITDKGRFRETDGKIELVSNGYGTTKLPLRLGAEAQYHVYTIQPKSADPV